MLFAWCLFCVHVQACLSWKALCELCRKPGSKAFSLQLHSLGPVAAKVSLGAVALVLTKLAMPCQIYSHTKGLLSTYKSWLDHFTASMRCLSASVHWERLMSVRAVSKYTFMDVSAEFRPSTGSHVCSETSHRCWSGPVIVSRFTNKPLLVSSQDCIRRTICHRV